MRSVAIIRLQSGAALLVVLVVLLMMTLLGITSLKSGLFHERMAHHSQADALTFLGAESAINSILSMVTAFKSDVAFEKSAFFELMAIAGSEQCYCIAKNKVSEGLCSANETFDRRTNGMLVAQASTSYLKSSGSINNDTDVFAYHEFSTLGAAYLLADVNLPFAYQNNQHWKISGTSQGFSMTARDLGMQRSFCSQQIKD
ncbi:MAG: hypothetical protein CSA49_00290 [Gammaproteobacteria bacterium]|nr:MAG: hypothetical protein CSA49_00290 [Gammaproteobacteria bacterium]